MQSAPADPTVLERIDRARVQRAGYWLPSGARGTVEWAPDQWETAIGRFISD